MTNYLIRCVLFVSLGWILLNYVISPVFIKNRQLNSYHGKWPVQAVAIEKSKNRIEENFIILGDSISHQLYHSLKYSPAFTTTGATLISGQYILAMNIYRNNPDIKAIFILNSPLSILHPFEYKNTYRNFIIPFYTLGNREFFTKRIISKMNRNPYTHFAIFPYIKISNLLSDIILKESDSIFLNVELKPYAIDYYKKFQEFSQKTGVVVKMIPLPLKEKFKRHYQGFQALEEQIKNNSLLPIFDGFISNIEYTDDKYYMDNVHYKKNYINKVRHIINKRISKDLSDRGIEGIESITNDNPKYIVPKI